MEITYTNVVPKSICAPVRAYVFYVFFHDDSFSCFLCVLAHLRMCKYAKTHNGFVLFGHPSIRLSLRIFVLIDQWIFLNQIWRDCFSWSRSFSVLSQSTRLVVNITGFVAPGSCVWFLPYPSYFLHTKSFFASLFAKTHNADQPYATCRYLYGAVVVENC